MTSIATVARERRKLNQVKKFQSQRSIWFSGPARKPETNEEHRF